MSSNSWIRGPCTVDFKSFQNLSLSCSESSTEKHRDILTAEDKKVLENWETSREEFKSSSFESKDITEQLFNNEELKTIKIRNDRSDVESVDTMQLMKLVDRLEMEEDIAAHNTRFYTERYRKIKRRLHEVEKMIREEEKRQNTKKSCSIETNKLIEENKIVEKEDSICNTEKVVEDVIEKSDKYENEFNQENINRNGNGINSLNSSIVSEEKIEYVLEENDNCIVIQENNNNNNLNNNSSLMNNSEVILMPHKTPPVNPPTFERTKRNVNKLLERWKTRKDTIEILSESY